MSVTGVIRGSTIHPLPLDRCPLTFPFGGKTVSHGNDAFDQRPDRVASESSAKIGAAAGCPAGLSGGARLDRADAPDPAARLAAPGSRPCHWTKSDPRPGRWRDHYQRTNSGGAG